MEQAHTQLIAQLNERILAADNTPLYIKFAETLKHQLALTGDEDRLELEWHQALAVVLSFILTLLLGFEDIPVEEAAAQARKYQSVQPTVAKEVSLN